tara:strand:- start:817 stop:1200 length:384 start_codon:yes stop_codon:yes gene_type:complete
MPIKTTLKSITKRLDDIVRKIVRSRDKVCITCGYNDTLQVSHYISRTHISTRWDLKNCNLQCSRCHFSWHKGFVLPYQKHLIKTYGRNILTYLESEGKKLAYQVGLAKLFQREELYKKLKKELKKYL